MHIVPQFQQHNESKSSSSKTSSSGIYLKINQALVKSKDVVILWSWMLIQTLHMSVFKVRITWLSIAITVNSFNRSFYIPTTTESIVDPFSTEKKTLLSPHILQEWRKVSWKVPTCLRNIWRQHAASIWLLSSVNHFFVASKVIFIWSAYYGSMLVET